MVEWVEGTIDSLVGTVKSVAEAIADAVGDVIQSIAGVLKDIADWALADVADMVRAVITAGRTIAELVEGAFNAGFQILTQIMRGLEAAGIPQTNETILLCTAWSTSDARVWHCGWHTQRPLPYLSKGVMNVLLTAVQYRERSFGEVDDVNAAARFLAKLA